MSFRSTRTRTRTLAAVGFLAAAGLFLTACGPEDSVAGSDPSSAGSGSSSASPSQGGSGKAGNGTFTGTLTYLAPGKLLVGEQAFYVAEDTVITGGEICGDPETQEAELCTADELDATAKDGTMKVKVTMKNGIAERVVQP